MDECDRCMMEPGEVGPFGICCACSIGQGASRADCQCPWGGSVGTATIPKRQGED